MNFTFPEIIVAIVFFILAGTCVINWVFFKEYEALGMIVPALFFSIMYFMYALYPQIDEPTRKLWVRLGLIIVGADLLAFRIVFILRNRGK